MGPTASGKTHAAIELADSFPCDIISVDSAMVYRGMDIGTAKPDPLTLKRAPHRLIDLLDPAEVYSAGQFRVDALREMSDIVRRKRIPLLVGGTMLYFRALQRGIASLPQRDATVRAALDERAGRLGWPVLHAELARIDAVAAARIAPTDAQRIQRALEVHQLTGQPISRLQRDTPAPKGWRFVNLRLEVADRGVLATRIQDRLEAMLTAGFLSEVKRLHAREDLQARTPSMRTVGYRQLWQHLDGECSLDEATASAVTATRQLAKRQTTWLRSAGQGHGIDALAPDAVGKLARIVRKEIESQPM